MVEILAQLICFGLFLYQWIIIVAIVLTWVSADPYNPVVQWINRLTWPVWNWCGRHLPSSLRPFNAYFALLAVIFLQIFIPSTIISLKLLVVEHQDIFIALKQEAGHALLGAGIVIQSALSFFMLTLAIWFFLTLVNPSAHNPIVRVLFTLVDPMITPFQRYLPRTHIDLSPLVALFLFFMINTTLISPLIHFGFSLALPVKPCVF
ncbi:YggT family protein [Deltaproteobacteria bacterium TL4]